MTVYGKGGKTRSILIPASVWGSLLGLKGTEAEDAPVFRSRKHGHLRKAAMERVVRKAAQRAGVLRLVSPHWLRHAHASHALDRNAPTRPILRIAHADLDAWLDRHRHDPEVQKAVGQQTMKLEGTRFISTASPEFGEPELDTRRRFRPRERQKA